MADGVKTIKNVTLTCKGGGISSTVNPGKVKSCWGRKWRCIVHENLSLLFVSRELSRRRHQRDRDDKRKEEKKKKAEQIKLLLMLHVLQTHNKQTETYLNRVTERPTTDESKKGGKTKEKGIVLSTLTSKMSAYDRCCLTNCIDP